VGEGGSGGGIGKIIGRHVHGLDGGNGSYTGGGNALLEETHISGEGGLVTDSGGDTAEKGGHLGAGLGETENVVDEEKHILALLVTEVLSDGETGEGDTGTSSRGLVHLAVHEGSLGAGDGLAGGLVNLNDTTLNHLVVEIVTLAGSLTDTGEDGVTTVVHGNVVDELHDNDLTYFGL
jgi:peptide chain release factor 1